MKFTYYKKLCFVMVMVLLGTIFPMAYAEGSPSGLSQESAALHAFYPSSLVYSAEVEKYIDDVDSVSFAWSRFDADNSYSLNTTRGKNGNYDFYYPSDFAKSVRYAKSKGKSIQISIFADSRAAVQFLPYKEKRSKVIASIVNLVKKDITGDSLFYDGVVIDFEGLRDSSGGTDILVNGKRISEHFNSFLTELKLRLAPLDKKLLVAVNPRLYFNGYDYGRIIGIADHMILMAHDYEHTGLLQKREVLQFTGYDALNPIDSLAPYRKVRLALEDIQNSIGTAADMKKVWLQVSFDSAQWRYDVASADRWEMLDGSVMSKEGRLTPTYKMIKARVDNKDGMAESMVYGYNNELQSPYIQYYHSGDKTMNIILYEDSNSMAAKINMAKNYGIGGVSVWSLGNIADDQDEKGKQYHLDVWGSILHYVKATSSDSKGSAPVTFIDQAVESAVRNRIGKSEGKLYKSDVEGIYRFSLPKEAKRFDDLKHLTNLEYLDAKQADISSIKFLSSLTNLRVLYLQRNRITDISPLKNLKKLEILSLNGNGITGITALRDLKSLKELYLRENKISSILALAGLTELRKLYLDSNKITDLGSLSGLKNLYELGAELNQIKDITPLRGLVRLKYLNLANNQIRNIEALKGLSSLNMLYLEGNPIRDFSPVKSLFGNLADCDFEIP